jgi:hypothetical protein
MGGLELRSAPTRPQDRKTKEGHLYSDPLYYMERLLLLSDIHLFEEMAGT